MPIVMALSDGARVFGQVRTSDGHGVPASVLKLSVSMPPFSFDVSTIRTDGNGAFDFDFVPRVGNVVLAAQHPTTHETVSLTARIRAQGEQLLLNPTFKALFARPRPWFADPFVVEKHSSFPSGHSMGSMIFYSLVAYLAVTLLPGRRGKVVLAAWLGLLVLLVGFSRIYLGAHWPTDVLGGYAAGACWVVLVIVALEWIRRRPLPPAASEEGHSEKSLA